MKSILLSVAVLLLTNCQSTPNEAVITGTVRTPGLEAVTAILNTNPFFAQEHFTDSLSADGTFELNVPIVRLSNGYFEDGKYRHGFVLLPGDAITAEIDRDTVRYTGRGAEKNNFLYALERARLDERAMAAFYNRGRLELQPFADSLKAIAGRRVAFLNGYPGYDRLEPEFREWFEIQTQVVCNQNMLLYADGEDSLPPVYDEALAPANLFRDEYTASGNYLSTMNYFMYLSPRGREIIQKALQDTTLTDAQNAIREEIAALMPSRSRDWFRAYESINGMRHTGPDSALLAQFRQTAADTVAINAVDRKLAKYGEKQALIGQPLHESFRRTMLRDTADVALSFGEMLARYKEQVVYLDVWSLGCGPYIAEMPNSKVLKEKLVGQPVAFVYLTHDGFEGMWPESFEKTFTTENHYRLEKSFESEMFQFLEINRVPCYMIFDREGKLVSYTASRPSDVESDLLEALER